MSNKQAAQFCQAISIIYHNLDKPLVLTAMANELSISVSSLKRLFQQYVAQSPGEVIRRLRMEYAFRRLQNGHHTVMDTALDIGFEDPSAFARSFKKQFGVTPTDAVTNHPHHNLEYSVLPEPEIMASQEFTMQCITTTANSYFEAAPQSWAQLYDAMDEALSAEDAFAGLYVGLGHDDPHTAAVGTPVRFSAGITLTDKDLHIERIVIRGGNYARFDYKGVINRLGLAYHYILGQWAQHASWQINFKHPLFTVLSERPNPKIEQVMKIWVPLED